MENVMTSWMGIKKTMKIARRYGGTSFSGAVNAIFPNAKKDGIVERFSKRAQSFGKYIETHPGVKKLGLAVAAAIVVRTVIGADMAYADTGDLANEAANAMNDQMVDPSDILVSQDTLETTAIDETPVEAVSEPAELETQDIQVEEPVAADEATMEVQSENAETYVVDGEEVVSEEPIEVEDATLEAQDTELESQEAPVITVDIPEADTTINLSDLGDAKTYSAEEGKVVEFVVDAIDDEKVAETMVMYSPDGKLYVAMAPQHGLSRDSMAQYFEQLYTDGKVPYNYYDESTWPAEWVAEGVKPEIDWKPGILSKGSVLDTILGKITAYYDAAGNAHFITDGQAIEIVNTSDGFVLDQSHRPDPDTIPDDEFNKNYLPEPDEPEKPEEPVQPDEPEKSEEPKQDEPEVPVDTQDVPTQPMPEKSESSIPKLGENDMAFKVATAFALASGGIVATAGIHKATTTTVSLQPSGYSYAVYEKADDNITKGNVR